MEWVSVKDKLPEFSVNILFYAGLKDGIRLGRLYRHSHRFISDGDKFYMDEVTHWAELKPPEE